MEETVLLDRTRVKAVCGQRDGTTVTVVLCMYMESRDCSSVWATVRGTDSSSKILQTFVLSRRCVAVLCSCQVKRFQYEAVIMKTGVTSVRNGT